MLPKKVYLKINNNNIHGRYYHNNIIGVVGRSRPLDNYYYYSLVFSKVVNLLLVDR